MRVWNSFKQERFKNHPLITFKRNYKITKKKYRQQLNWKRKVTIPIKTFAIKPWLQASKTSINISGTHKEKKIYKIFHKVNCKSGHLFHGI